MLPQCGEQSVRASILRGLGAPLTGSVTATGRSEAGVAAELSAAPAAFVTVAK
jgi:hypothetical protein